MTAVFAPALRALQKRDEPALLEALVEAWRRWRNPALASAIEARSPPAEGVARKQWLAAAKKRPTDVPALVATPWPATWQQAQEWLPAVNKLADDPRLATWLAHVLETVPWTARGALAVYEAIGRRLVTLADSRAIEIIHRGAKNAAKHYDASDLRELLEWVVEEIDVAAHEATRPLAPADRDAWAELEKAVGGRAPRQRTGARGSDPLEELLAAVYARPGDESARRVYADALLETGDPRGELILLQCERAAGRSTRETVRREKQLLDKHFDAWLGPLAGVVRREGVVFERGFLEAVDTKLRAYGALAPVTGDPRWSTVRAISIDTSWSIDTSTIAPFLRHPVMRALQRVRGIWSELVLQVAQQGPLPWEDVSVSDCADPAALDRALPSARRLQSTRELADLQKVLATPLADRAEALEVVGTPAEWMAWCRAREPEKLTTLDVLGSGDWRYVFTREAGAWALHVSRRRKLNDAVWVNHYLLPALGELPPGSFTRLEVTLPRGGEEYRAAIEKWAAARDVSITFS